MAETLGSLIDKLTIKNLREFYIRQVLDNKKSKKLNRIDLKNKLKILKSQKGSLLSEIDSFITRAIKGEVVLTDDKLKLYNEPGITKIEEFKNISSGIDKLAKKNIELWYLEDEARREDVNDAYIGKVKKKIDKANQERCDLIDAIDYLFKGHLKKYKGRKAR